MENNKYFYFGSFLFCLLMAYFFGFRSRQSSGLANLNSILADFGSGSFLGMLFGWVMSIFWTVMLVIAYGGLAYSGYKIYSIYSTGELTELKKTVDSSTTNGVISKDSMQLIKPKNIITDSKEEIIKP